MTGSSAKNLALKRSASVKTRNGANIKNLQTDVCLTISYIILLHEKSLQFDWFRAVVFQLNLKYLHVKITNLLRVVV